MLTAQSTPSIRAPRTARGQTLLLLVLGVLLLWGSGAPIWRTPWPSTNGSGANAAFFRSAEQATALLEPARPRAAARPPAGLSAEEWQEVQEAIRRAEYQFTWNETTATYQAPNRANGFRAQVSAGGLRLVPLREGEVWAWGLQLAGYGYEGRVRPVTATPTLAGDRHRVTLRHTPTLTEWYDNQETGLEHGFTLAEPPREQQAPPGGRLVLELRVRGTLVPQQTADGDAILFRDPRGTLELRYSTLVVTDADGRRLPASLRLAERAGAPVVQIVVDAGEARYPITVDPIVNAFYLATLFDAHGQTGDELGFSVAIDGDVLLVGAPYVDVDGYENRGAAYVFYRNQGGADSWKLVATLVAPDGRAKDNFGWSVALSGNVAVVGAPLDDVNGVADAGSVHVFFRDWGGADNWGWVRQVTAISGGSVTDKFGMAVAVDGTTLAVGAPGQDVGPKADQGAVHLYELSGDGGLREVIAITPTDGAADDEVGDALALDDDLLLVGAPGADVGSASDQGAAYLFARNQGGAENWGQVTKLTASDGAAGDAFGRAVALDGDMALIGAPLADIAGQSNQGAAYIFERNQGGADNWGQVKKLVASDGSSDDSFGSAVALREGLAVVGAPDYGTLSPLYQGALYIFARNQGGQDN